MSSIFDALRKDFCGMFFFFRRKQRESKAASDHQTDLIYLPQHYVSLVIAHKREGFAAPSVRALP